MELDNQGADHRPSMPALRYRPESRPTTWRLCVAPAIYALATLAVASWL